MSFARSFGRGVGVPGRVDDLSGDLFSVSNEARESLSGDLSGDLGFSR